MQTKPLTIPVGQIQLPGDLKLPEHPVGLTLFAHGSGSSLHSPRNQFVAWRLARYGIASLLFDLITPEEDRLDDGTGQFRFDIPLLADRLVKVSRFALHQPETSGLPQGFFGASTGAAAAVIAAAALPESTCALVSRGGRPDLAGSFLSRVKAPTLLIVGGQDTQVLELNEQAAKEMVNANVEMRIVPEAGHLFEGHGQLENVADLAAQWFASNMNRLRPGVMDAAI